MTKIKIKTRKSVTARFKVTGTGRLTHKSPGKRHLLSGKTSKRKRQLRGKTLVNNIAQEKTMKRLMGLI